MSCRGGENYLKKDGENGKGVSEALGIRKLASSAQAAVVSTHSVTYDRVTIGN